jgi:hypothetical protein
MIAPTVDHSFHFLSVLLDAANVSWTSAHDAPSSRDDDEQAATSINDGTTDECAKV